MSWNFTDEIGEIDWVNKDCPPAVVPERMISMGHAKNRRLTGGMIKKYGMILPLVEPRSRILDVCSGSGWGSYYMAKSGHNVIGVDHDTDLLELCELRDANNLKYIYSDIFELDLEEQFDAITCVDAIEHFTQEDQIRVMRKIDEHLKPGGLLMIDTPWGVIESRRTGKGHLWELSWGDFEDLIKHTLYFDWMRRFVILYEHEFSLISEVTGDPGKPKENGDQQIIVRKRW